MPVKRVAILHELNPQGQHRLVFVNEDGTNETSPWVGQEQIVEMKGIYAQVNPGLGLPFLVFTVREVTHQALA